MSPLNRTVRFRAYVGPRYVSRTQETQMGQWDWADDIYNVQLVPTLVPYIGQRTLSANINSPSQTTGLAVSGGLNGYPNNPPGTNLPQHAGIWVGPNGVGQGWEYIEYMDAGATMRRNNQRYYNNLHSSGAPVYFWYPLDTNDGKLSISLEQTDNMTVRSWTAKLSGVKAPTQILKPDHIFCVEMDTSEAGTGSFQRVLWGIIDRVSMGQDSSHLGTWDLQILSFARYYQMVTIPGLRVGPMDVAEQAEASASSTLGAAWKLSLPQQVQVEAGYIPEIDFVEVQQDAGPSNVVDGNRDTLWVSDGWLGNPAQTTNTAGVQGWASVFTYPPPENVFGSRYFEVINFSPLRDCQVWIYYKYSYPDPSGSYRGRWIEASEFNVFSQSGVDEDTFGGPEDRVIVAENATIFRQVFPAANPKVLIDAMQLSGGADPEIARRLWWEAGAMFLRDSLNSYFMWHWGSVTYGELDTEWGVSGSNDFDLPASSFYLDTSGIRPGMVFRRELFNSTFVMVKDYVHFPGYQLDSNIGGNNPEWLKITLPEMTHLLRDDITAATTSIYLVDAQGNPNVEGISKNTTGGKIYINDEAISFTSKNYANGVLTGCTVTKPHKAGTRVYVCYHIEWPGVGNATLPAPWQKPFEDKLFEVATAAYPIKTMNWGRGYYGSGAERTPYLGNYAMRFSMYPDARHPPEDNHEADYWLLLDAATHTPSLATPNVTITTDDAAFNDLEENEGFRPRTVIFEMRSMNETGTAAWLLERPRMNYFEAEVDRDFFDKDRWVALPGSGLDNYQFCYDILFAAGAYPRMLVPENPEGDPSPKRWRGMTDRDTAWRIVADAAEYGCSEVDVALEGVTYIRPNKYLLNVAHPTDHVINEDEVARVQITNIRPAEIGQVALTWEYPKEGLAGTAYYPPTNETNQEIIEIGPLLLSDQSTAEIVATNIYETRRFAYNVFIELNRYDDNYALGDVVNLVYKFDHTGTNYVNRLLLIETIEHEISGLTGTTVLGCREIERGTG